MVRVTAWLEDASVVGESEPVAVSGLRGGDEDAAVVAGFVISGIEGADGWDVFPRFIGSSLAWAPSDCTIFRSLVVV